MTHSSISIIMTQHLKNQVHTQLLLFKKYIKPIALICFTLYALQKSLSIQKFKYFLNLFTL